MRAILRQLRNPHRAYSTVIVAGTNGKGSTAATLASIFKESGYVTGLYTSPHLVDIHERWMIGGAVIDDRLLEQSVDLLRKASAATGVTPTYFEALTIVAFIAFRLAKCEVVVLEVGMGGRLDATNVVRPIASVITPIGFDHTEFLGSTLRRIAREKAGVIHRGAVVLTSNDDPAVIEVLRRRAETFGNRFHRVTTEHDTPLPGEFQRRNAALAVRTAEELMTALPRITSATIDRGVARVRWRGRLEQMAIGRKDVWIDGCHNAHAVTAVLPFIEQHIRTPRLLVFGIMGDKDVSEVVSLLFPRFDKVITTEPYPPRSATASDLADRARTYGVPAEAVADPEEAFARAVASEESSIFIGGSLYLAGAAVAFFDTLRGEESDR
ncbi:MAG TPA: folylpolyglutamate synthase/dihydrofolate synthase family protein [Thermoanaerobaculia bacterium]|nr:folylpolyglutamate synthase/dihydrofolate synthase family protein [Thermoanaerobaculia bacterium]